MAASKHIWVSFDNEIYMKPPSYIWLNESFLSYQKRDQYDLVPDETVNYLKLSK